ncbi:MAG: MGMT family protein [Bdellovibrionota bacterium]
MEELWKLLKKIPKGKVSTYKAVCEKLKLKNPRNVGWMLKHNENAPTIPCHRVIQSSGHIGGYNGVRTGTEITRKIKLLKSEGVSFNPQGKIEDSSRILYKL